MLILFVLILSVFSVPVQGTYEGRLLSSLDPISAWNALQDSEWSPATHQLSETQFCSVSLLRIAVAIILSSPINHDPIQSNPIIKKKQKTRINQIKFISVHYGSIQSNPIKSTRANTQSNPVQSNQVKSNPFKFNPIKSNDKNGQEFEFIINRRGRGEGRKGGRGGRGGRGGGE